jgi:hypothetical protein
MSRPIMPTPKLNRKETVSFVNRLWSEGDTKEIINLHDSVRKARKKKHTIKRIK